MNVVTVENAGETARTVKGGAVVGPSTVRRSPAIAALAAALCKAQGEMRNPPKDSVNPHFKSRYADLATVRDAVMPVLSKHGLAVMQLPCELDDAPALTTLLVHTSGEWVETTIKLRPSKSDPQGVGSALTYLRRYSLQSIAGVAADDDDDDGNAASRSQQPAHRPEPAPKADAPANLPLRARYAQEAAVTDSRDALTAVWRRYEIDLEAGRLGAADADALLPLFKERAAKFPKQPAGK